MKLLLCHRSICFYCVLQLCIALGCSGTSDETAADTLAADVPTEDVGAQDTAADTATEDLVDTEPQETEAPDSEDTTAPDTAAPDTGAPDTTASDTATDTVQGKPDGELCSGHSACLSGNCRKSPDGTFQCTPADKPCADGSGGGLATGEKLCVHDDSLTCTGDDTFDTMACDQSCGYFPAVSGCSAGECTACATSCTQSNECDEGATCNASGVCVPGAQGVVCNDHGDCPSNNCRPAPDGTKRCVPEGTECADGSGGGLVADESVCYSGDVVTCQAGGSFAPPLDCATDCGSYVDVDGCTEGSCQPCPTSCGDDSFCKPQGHCDAANQCVQDAGVGQLCERDAMCDTDNCRQTPEGTFLCVAAVADCAAADGTPLGGGEKICHGGDSHICIGKDTFSVQDCANECGHYLAVDSCTGGECEPCPTGCSSDSQCDEDAHCDVTSQCAEKSPSGIGCTDDSGCESSNCRKAPNDQYYCTPAGKACADKHGGGLDIGEGACHENDLYECNAQDSFTAHDCATDCGLYPDVDSCEADACKPCPTTCTNDDDCKASAHCTDGQCYSGELGSRCDDQDDADCDSGNCRKGPDTQYYCTPPPPQTYLCSDGAGGGLEWDVATCYENHVYRCVDENWIPDKGSCHETTCQDGWCRCGSATCWVGHVDHCEGDPPCRCGANPECPSNMGCVKVDQAYHCTCSLDVCDLEKSDRCTTVSGSWTCVCGTRESSCPGDQFCGPSDPESPPGLSSCSAGTCCCEGGVHAWPCHEGHSDGCVPPDPTIANTCACGANPECPKPADLQAGETYMRCSVGACRCGRNSCLLAGTAWTADRCSADFKCVCGPGASTPCGMGMTCDPYSGTCHL